MSLSECGEDDSSVLFNSGRYHDSAAWPQISAGLYRTGWSGESGIHCADSEQFIITLVAHIKHKWSTVHVLCMCSDLKHCPTTHRCALSCVAPLLSAVEWEWVTILSRSMVLVQLASLIRTLFTSWPLQLEMWVSCRVYSPQLLPCNIHTYTCTFISNCVK